MSSTDKIIRDKLYNHSVSVPPALWSKIESSIEPTVVTEPKHRSKLWLGLVLILLISTCTYVGYQQLGFTAFAKPMELDVNSNNSAAAVSSVNTEDTKEEPAESESDEIESNASKLTVHEAPVKNQITNQKINNNSILNKSILSNIDSEQNENSEKQIENLARLENAKEELGTDQEAVNPITPLMAKDRRMENLSLLDPKSNTLFSESAVEAPSLRVFKSKESDCPDFQRHVPGIYGEAYVALDYADRSLKSKTAEFTDYRMLRDDTESSLISFAGGIRVSLVLSSGLTFKTGLSYTQINEHFSIIDQNSSQTITIIVTDTLWTANGPEVTTQEQVITQPGTRIIETYNKYRFLDIPVIVGYEFNLGRFAMAVNGGAFLNLSFTQKGQFLNPNGKPSIFSSSEPNPYPAFRSKASMSLYGSLALYYHVYENIDIMIEPRVRYFIDSITESTYELEQNYVTTGLITGVRYKF